MNVTNEIASQLIFLAVVVLMLYGLIVVIGNHWILRAGGQSAHENYPKIINELKTGFAVIIISFLLFFLVIFEYIPGEVLVTLVSVAAGVFGSRFIRDKS